jgi:kinesin family protein 18/19
MSAGALPMDAHVQEMSDGKDNILVTVRVRPEHPMERTAKFRNIIRVLDKNVLSFDPPGPQDEDAETGGFFGNSTRRCKDIKYAFDRIFDETCSQLEVYEGTTKFLIDGVLNGYNATVFAYGATGAGKTYTMMGCDHSGPGVMVLTMIDLFKAIEHSRSERTVKVSMSYLEVYNEQIRDLLNPTTKSTSLELREDKCKGMVVANLAQVTPADADEVLRLLEEGNRNRTQHPTEANATSSRSHAVLQIMIEQQDRTSNIQADVRYAKLSLIDLAGSERAAVTKNSGIRLTEGANINKSLLALGNCINALAAGANNYVPYRNSKLTRLLKDSLGGNCRTVMIAALSPSSVCYEDTHNTLKYANRAKNIKMKVERNVLNVNYHISQYTQIIAELRAQVEELQRTAANPTMAAGANAAKTAMMLAGSVHMDRNFDAMREKIAASFGEMMRAKRSLMEVEERERQLAHELSDKQTEIEEWMERNPEANECAESIPVRILTLQREVASANTNKARHEDLMQKLQSRFVQAEKAWKAVKDEVPRAVSSHEGRFALEQCFAVRELEIQNMELSCVIERQKKQIESMQVQLLDGDAHFLGLDSRRLSYSDYLVTPLRPSHGSAGMIHRMSPMAMPVLMEEAQAPTVVVNIAKAASAAATAPTAVSNGDKTPTNDRQFIRHVMEESQEAAAGKEKGVVVPPLKFNSMNNDVSSSVCTSATKNKENATAFHISLAERRKQFKRMKQAWGTPRDGTSGNSSSPDEEDGPQEEKLDSQRKVVESQPTTSARSILDRLCKPTVSSRQKIGKDAGVQQQQPSQQPQPTPSAGLAKDIKEKDVPLTARDKKKSVKFAENEGDVSVLDLPSARGTSASASARDTYVDRPTSAPPTVSVSLTLSSLRDKENQPIKIASLGKGKQAPTAVQPATASVN